MHWVRQMLYYSCFNIRLMLIVEQFNSKVRFHDGTSAETGWMEDSCIILISVEFMEDQQHKLFVLLKCVNTYI